MATPFPPSPFPPSRPQFHRYHLLEASLVALAALLGLVLSFTGVFGIVSFPTRRSVKNGPSHE